MSEKTEAPTPRRLRKARSEGDVAVSGALGQGLALLVMITLAPAAVAATAAREARRLQTALTSGGDFDTSWLPLEVLALCAPLLLAGALASLAVGLVQSGGAVSAKKLAPELARLDPIRGLRQLVTLPRAFALLRAILGALVVGSLAARLLVAHAPAIANTLGEPAPGGALAGVLAWRLVLIAALVGLCLGVVDYAVVRHSWWRRLRMSKDEVKREHRESEGDPELKAARRRAHEELLTQTVVAAVREASVVVINPTHLATALRYLEDEEAAPQVVAHGRGDLAQKLIEAARAYGVPVIRDVPVARALADLELGEEIPEALYEAVAEILRAAWAERPPAPIQGEPALSPAPAAGSYFRTRA